MGRGTAFLTNGSGAIWSPDGTRIAYTRDGEPSGSQIWVRWMDAEGATTQITQLEQSPSNLELVAGRQVDRVHDARAEARDLADSDAGAARRREVDRGAAHRRELTYRADRQGFIEQGLTSDLHRPRGRRHPAADHGRAEYDSRGESVHAGRQGDRLLGRTREGLGTRVSPVRRLRAERRNRRVRQLTKRSGPDGNPTLSPDGRWIAYLGYDYTTDTYIDNELYVIRHRTGDTAAH